MFLAFTIIVIVGLRIEAIDSEYPSCVGEFGCWRPVWYDFTELFGISYAVSSSFVFFLVAISIPSLLFWITWRAVGRMRGIILDIKTLGLVIGQLGKQAKHEGLSTISKASSVSQRSSKELKAALQGKYDDLELSMIDQKEKIRGAQRRDSARSTSVKKDAVISDVERKEEQSPVVEDFYERAWEELETKAYPKGLWARLFAENEGDENKTKIAFIKARVEQLRSGEG